MPPRLRPDPRCPPRPSPLAEFSALSRTPHLDWPAHHIGKSVSGLDSDLPSLLPRPSSPAGCLFRCPPRRRCRTARGCALSCCSRRHSAAPLRKQNPGSRLASRSARSTIPDQFCACPALSPVLRRYARQRKLQNDAHLIPPHPHASKAFPQSFPRGTGPIPQRRAGFPHQSARLSTDHSTARRSRS
jgi:hypothetical protein